MIVIVIYSIGFDETAAAIYIKLENFQRKLSLYELP